MCAFVQGYNNGAGHSLSPHANLEASLIFFQGKEAKAMGDWRLDGALINDYLITLKV